MLDLILNTVYPCCGGPAAFVSTTGVPREMFDRSCRRCHQRWTIERRTVTVLATGGRFDQLTWTPVH